MTDLGMNAEKLSNVEPDDDAAAATGCWAMASIAALNGIQTQPEALLSRLVRSGPRLMSYELARLGRSLNLRTAVRHRYLRRPERLPTPCIGRCVDGTYAIIAAIADGQALVQRMAGQPQVVPLPDLGALFVDDFVVVTRRAIDLDHNTRFGLGWFWNQVLRYRPQMRDILLASLLVQVLGLITPLLFQAITDKVLVHQTVDTLHVIAIAMLLVALFEVGFDLLRQYLLGHTASRIDADLGSRLYAHLVDLPMSFFSGRPVGNTVQRLRELEHINEFFTGQALTALLDLMFIVIYLVMMLFYSVQLTAVVVISLPIYALISLAVLPALRRRLDEMFMRNANCQAFLVESVTGIETVKGGALGTTMRRDWEVLLAGQVSSRFDIVRLSSLGNGAVQLLNKLVYLLVLYLGARLVIDQHLTVGGLIAFTMFTSHVTAPILRLAGLWNGFQQVRVSIARIGEVMDAPIEQTAATTTRLPQLQGGIRLEKVAFRYHPSQQDVLRGLDLDIPAGAMVGIVGRSGSGKSTIAKLVQRLYVPTQGRLTIDGVDGQMLDPYWLRTRIGVVGQEGFLFNRTVRENIAISDPGISMDAVVEACRLSGAHDFIASLPAGYDTLLEERGSNLSGGQRQRLAIARAIVTQPSILIFDEATSALDPETEEIVRANMKRICSGRTSIIISHRLSTIQDADVIHVIDAGQIAESGTHSELVDRGGWYSRLFAGQGSTK